MRTCRADRPARIAFNDHLANPVLNDRARLVGEQSVRGEDEIAVSHESDVRWLARDQRSRAEERSDRSRVVEAGCEEIEKLGLGLGRQVGLVLERIGDATDQVRSADGRSKLTRQQSNAQRERSRACRQDCAAKSFARLLFCYPCLLHSRLG
jgi:hypothetical protein